MSSASASHRESIPKRIPRLNRHKRSGFKLAAFPLRLIYGGRHIAGGRFVVRCALYMAALSAVKHDAILKPFYLRLHAKIDRAHEPPSKIQTLNLPLNTMLRVPQTRKTSRIERVTAVTQISFAENSEPE
jgi:hypothetical protein